MSETLHFLKYAQTVFESRGYTVETLRIATDVMMAELTLPDGKPLKTFLSFAETAPGTLWHYAPVERSLFAQVKNTPVRLHITFYLTVLGDPHTEAVPRRWPASRAGCRIVPVRSTA